MRNPEDFSRTRRELLRYGLATALGSTSVRAALGLLAGAGASAVEAQTDDYKALVCLYLFGGNDGYNVLVPRNGGFYTQYAQARGNLALPQAQLLSLPGSDVQGREFGLHPAMPELQSLYQSGRLAFVANLGTLLTPTTKTSYAAGSHLPPRLFSHNDQQDQSMSCEPDALQRVGWGGRLAERLHTLNGSPQLSMNVSIAGNNRFQTGDSVVPYVMSSNGAVELAAFNGSAQATLNRRAVYDQLLLQAQTGHLFERHGGALTARSMQLAAQVDAALSSVPALTTVFPDGNRLGDQLRTVAQMIAARTVLGMKRQVFFVSLGGFDTHDDQLIDQPVLLSQISQAMRAFYDATTELGVAERVTTFTMTDFGRTLTSNGDGTDHAWGNIAWVSSGAVNGGQVYGTFPQLTINGADDAGQGRLIPTTAIDQYGATLARWLGASESDLDVIFPHLSRFPTRGLGFLS